MLTSYSLRSKNVQPSVLGQLTPLPHRCRPPIQFSIVPSDNSDNTGRTHFPVSLPYVTISIQYILVIASLSKSPSAVVVPAISDVPPVPYSQQYNIWI